MPLIIRFKLFETKTDRSERIKEINSYSCKFQ